MKYKEVKIARRQSRILLVLYLLCLVCIVWINYSFLKFFYWFLWDDNIILHQSSWLWLPKFFWISLAGTTAIVGGGTWLKLLSLKQGGEAIARELEGRFLVSESVAIPEERQLLNIVEEMAIATGVWVPDIYILDAEVGINAFAAGYSDRDAVIGVTRGCLGNLTREELQGLIAHLFARIASGDLRLNTRSISTLHGILAIYRLGKLTIFGIWIVIAPLEPLSQLIIVLIALPILIFSGTYAILVGLGWSAVGCLGYFWCRIIQRSLCRQQILLADTLAIQLTLNPEGLRLLLEKMGNRAIARVNSRYRDEMAHLFFADPVSGVWLEGWLATHPPLKERLARLNSRL